MLLFTNFKALPLGVGFLFVLLGALPVQAKSPGEAGFAFLRLSPFARSAGMGEAHSAFVGDITSLYSNPAGLAHLPKPQVSTSYLSHFQDVSFSHVAGAMPTKKGGLGVALGFLDAGDIKRTRFDATAVDRFVEVGDVDASDLYAGVSWGWRYNRDLALGVTAKVAQETLDSQSALSFLGDVGGIYRIDREWRAAVVVQNAGTSGKFISESVAPPTRVRAGLFWSPEKWMQWEGDIIHNFDGEPELAVGGEMNWNKKAYLRLGYQYSVRDRDLGALAGASLGVGARWKGLFFDYAYLPFDDLGDSNLVSFSWRFGGSSSQKKAANRPSR